MGRARNQSFCLTAPGRAAVAELSDGAFASVLGARRGAGPPKASDGLASVLAYTIRETDEARRVAGPRAPDIKPALGWLRQNPDVDGSELVRVLAADTFAREHECCASASCALEHSTKARQSEATGSTAMQAARAHIAILERERTRSGGLWEQAVEDVGVALRAELASPAAAYAVMAERSRLLYARYLADCSASQLSYEQLVAPARRAQLSELLEGAGVGLVERRDYREAALGELAIWKAVLDRAAACRGRYRQDMGAERRELRSLLFELVRAHMASAVRS